MNYFYRYRVDRVPRGHIEYGGFWSPLPYICLEATYLCEKNSIAADQHIIIENDRIKEYIIWDTAFSIEKMEKEITKTGFVLKDVFGEVCGCTYKENSETICFMLSKDQ
jgi:hypothetical protein